MRPLRFLRGSGARGGAGRAAGGSTAAERHWTRTRRSRKKEKEPPLFTDGGTMASKDRFEHFREAYLMMAKRANYRPSAPSDGFGTVMLSGRAKARPGQVGTGGDRICKAVRRRRLVDKIRDWHQRLQHQLSTCMNDRSRAAAYQRPAWASDRAQTAAHGRR